jgi:hypothetical protein
MRLSIPSGLRLRSGKPGNELQISLLLLLGERNGNAHAPTWFDSFYKTDNFDRMIQHQVGCEAGADPQRIDGLDEHAIRTDVAGACAKPCRAPFDIEAGAEVVTRRPPAFEPARRCLCDAHEAGEAPCLGSQASAHGLSRRSHVLRILSPQARDYDTGDDCFVPNNVASANSEYYSPRLAAGSSDEPSDGSFGFCERL